MFTAYTQKQMPYSIKTDIFKKKPVRVNHTLQPVDREDATLEAELGERAVVPDGTGLPTQFGIGGNRHSSGGTPLNLPAQSFIFSRDKSMRISDPKILEMFGMVAKKKGYTPAEIAKKYDINNFRKILADKSSDPIQRDTAESMITNYNEKLAKLALVQESHKGFPDGIPMIAIPYLKTSGLNPSELIGQQNADEEDSYQPDQDTARYGGFTKENIVPEMYTWNSHRTGGENKFQFRKGGEYTPRSNKGQVEIQYAKPLKKVAKTGGEQHEEELYRVKIVAPGLEKAQKGGQKGVPTYDPVEQKIIKTTFPGAVLPEDIVEEKQKPGSGVYGRFNKNEADKNWAWYGKPIDWTNPHDVSKAQQAYNDRLYKKVLDAGYDEDFAKKMVERVGFSSKEGDPNSLDGLAGKYTETRIDLNPLKKEEAKKVFPEIVKKAEAPKGPVPVTDVQAHNEETPADFWLQDAIKTAGAASDLFRIKKYLPWQGTYNPYLPQATYFDPTRELAQNSENANIAAQAAGMFGTPQQLSARLSQIQGNAGANAANILGRYNNMNVNASNQNEQQRTAIMNDYAHDQAAGKTQLYNENVIANQNFDNAKNMARQNLRNSFIDALTNRAQTQALNSIQKQYRVNPWTGGTKSFSKPGTDFPTDVYNNQLMGLVQGLGSNGSGSADFVDKLVNERGWDRKDAIDYLKAVSGK